MNKRSNRKSRTSRSLIIFASLFCAIAHAQPDLNRGLAAYIPMRADFSDHSGKGLPVNTTGVVTLREGAAYFDGGSNALTLPHINLANQPFAVSMWIKLTGRSPMYGLLYQEDQPNDLDRWLHLMLRGGRQPYLGFLMDDAISPEEIPLQQWTHLVFQYTGSRQELWINGRLLCARSTGPYQGTNGPTVVGLSPRWSNVPSKDFEGFMREVRIYQRALSFPEIELLAQVPTNPRNASNPDSALSNALAADVGVPFLDIQGSKLVITGESRQIYQVLGASDLRQAWTPLAVLTNQNGVVEFNDPDASKSSQRFYRVKTTSK